MHGFSIDKYSGTTNYRHFCILHISRSVNHNCRFQGSIPDIIEEESESEGDGEGASNGGSSTCCDAIEDYNNTTAAPTGTITMTTLSSMMNNDVTSNTNANVSPSANVVPSPMMMVTNTNNGGNTNANVITDASRVATTSPKFNTIIQMDTGQQFHQQSQQQQNDIRIKTQLVADDTGLRPAGWTGRTGNTAPQTRSSGDHQRIQWTCVCIVVVLT